MIKINKIFTTAEVNEAVHIMTIGKMNVPMTPTNLCDTIIIVLTAFVRPFISFMAQNEINMS